MSKQPGLPLVLTVLTFLILGCMCGSEETDISEGPENASQEGPATSGDVDLDKLPKTAGTFRTAKKWMYEKIYYDHRETLYCGCEFDEDKEPDLKGCGYTIRKSKSRAEQIEAEHVMPASFFGDFRDCWTQPLCTDSDGKAFDGRECCQEIDPVFNAAHNDLHNLYPTVGEVNGDRSSRVFGEVAGEDRAYGACDVEIDFDADVVEPAEAVRGEIARTYLYMSDTYNIALSNQQRSMFESWSKDDPPDRWEKDRNERIAAQQGNDNRYISAY